MEEEKIHVFLCREAALINSIKNGQRSQCIQDMLEEQACRFKINVVDKYDSISTLLNVGAEIDEVDIILKLYKFMKETGHERDIHTVVGRRLHLKRIERISSLIVSYYSKISEMGKSELYDVPDYISLFNQKGSFSFYVSHLPTAYKKFSFLPSLPRTIVGNSPPKVSKKRFPDFWTENRWITSDLLEFTGTVGIAVPDDDSIVQLSNDLKLLGIENSIISPISYFSKNNSQLNLLKSFLVALESNYSFPEMISLLGNSNLGLDGRTISGIKKVCYENNITDQWENWKIVLDFNKEIVIFIEKLQSSVGKRNEIISVLKEISNFYFETGRDEILELLDIIELLPEIYFSDFNSIVNVLDMASILITRTFPANSEIIIGKPVDLVGLHFDRLYFPRLDLSSYKKSFPDEVRELSNAMTGKDVLLEFNNSVYQELLYCSKEVILSYSTLDDTLTYTESIPFYDFVKGPETRISRQDVFRPIYGTNDPLQIPSNRYTLSNDGIERLLGGSISPSTFEVYLDCHFKYFLTSVLGIQDIDEPTEFLDPRMSGSLTHKILEKIYDYSISPLEFIKKADDFIRKEIENQKYISKRRALEFYRAKFITSGKLGRFYLLDYQSTRERGRSILKKEFKFRKDDGIFYEYDNKRVSINGIVDRIDEEGADLGIIDYKSSLSDYPKGKLCNERKIQLYIYKLGVEQLLKKKVKFAAYVSFKDVSEGYQTAGLYYGIPNEEMEMSNCRRIIDPAIGSLTAGDFDPFIKKHNDIVKCERTFYCSMLNVCRGQERRW